jgi:hypothetical protein
VPPNLAQENGFAKAASRQRMIGIGLFGAGRIAAAHAGHLAGQPVTVARRHARTAAVRGRNAS